MSPARIVLSAPNPARPRPAGPPCAPTRPARGMSGFWVRQVIHGLIRLCFRRHVQCVDLGRFGDGQGGCLVVGGGRSPACRTPLHGVPWKGASSSPAGWGWKRRSRGCRAERRRACEMHGRWIRKMKTSVGARSTQPRQHRSAQVDAGKTLTLIPGLGPYWFHTFVPPPGRPGRLYSGVWVTKGMISSSESRSPSLAAWVLDSTGGLGERSPNSRKTKLIHSPPRNPTVAKPAVPVGISSNQSPDRLPPFPPSPKGGGSGWFLFQQTTEPCYIIFKRPRYQRQLFGIASGGKRMKPIRIMFHDSRPIHPQHLGCSPLLLWD